MMGSAVSPLFSISLFFPLACTLTMASLADIVPIISQNCFMFPLYKQSLGCCFVHSFRLCLSFDNSGWNEKHWQLLIQTCDSSQCPDCDSIARQIHLWLCLCLPISMHLHYIICVWLWSPLLTPCLISIFLMGNVNGYMIIFTGAQAGNRIPPFSVTKETKRGKCYGTHYKWLIVFLDNLSCVCFLVFNCNTARSQRCCFSLCTN